MFEIIDDLKNKLDQHRPAITFNSKKFTRRPYCTMDLSFQYY